MLDEPHRFDSGRRLRHGTSGSSPVAAPFFAAGVRSSRRGVVQRYGNCHAIPQGSSSAFQRISEANPGVNSLRGARAIGACWHSGERVSGAYCGVYRGISRPRGHTSGTAGAGVSTRAPRAARPDRGAGHSQAAAGPVHQLRRAQRSRPPRRQSYRALKLAMRPPGTPLDASRAQRSAEAKSLSR